VANDHESATPPEKPAWNPFHEATAEPELGPVEDNSVTALRDLILELAGLEEAQRKIRSITPSPEAAPWLGELTRLKSRQRLVLRELRRRARRRARLRPGRHEPPTPPDLPNPMPRTGPAPAPLAPTG
jgi:hypothetical protein